MKHALSFRAATVLILIAVAVLSFGSAQTANAAEFRSGDSTTVPASETIDDDLYVTGNEVTIAGHVTGDLMSAARSVKIPGRVDGSVQLISGSLDVDGDVNGSIRAASGDVTIAGSVEGDVVVASGSLTLKSGGSIGGSIYVYSGDVDLQGPVNGDIKGKMRHLTINGPVGGNVNVTVEQLTLQSTARILGELTYTSTNPVETASGATVTGTSTHHQTDGRLPGQSAMSWLSSDLFRLLCGLIAGLVLVLLLPRGTAAVADAARFAPFTSFLIGLLLFWFLPFALLLLMITLIGAPIALIGFLSYLIVIYLSQVFLGLAIGRLILPKSWDTVSRGYNLLAMSIGVILLGVLRMAPLPFVSTVVAGLSAVFALGAIVVAIRAARRNQFAVAR